MYIQLVSISILYFIIWVPFVTLSIIRIFYDHLFLHDFMILFMNYFLYIFPLASPFICLIGLPAVRQRFRRPNWPLGRNNGTTQNRIGPTQTQQQHATSRRQDDEHTF